MTARPTPRLAQWPAVQNSTNRVRHGRHSRGEAALGEYHRLPPGHRRSGLEGRQRSGTQGTSSAQGSGPSGSRRPVERPRVAGDGPASSSMATGVMGGTTLRALDKTNGAPWSGSIPCREPTRTRRPWPTWRGIGNSSSSQRVPAFNRRGSRRSACRSAPSTPNLGVSASASVQPARRRLEGISGVRREAPTTRMGACGRALRVAAGASRTALRLLGVVPATRTQPRLARNAPAATDAKIRG